MGYPYIYISPGFGQSKKKNVLKYAANTSRVSHRDEVAKNARIAGMHSQIGIKSRFVNSREVSLCKLAQVRFISAIAGWS